MAEEGVGIGHTAAESKAANTAAVKANMHLEGKAENHGMMGGIGDFLGENGKSIGLAIGAVAAVGLLSKVMGKDMNPLLMLGVGAAAFFGSKMLMGGGEKHADGESVTASAGPNAAAQGNEGPAVG